MLVDVMIQADYTRPIKNHDDESKPAQRRLLNVFEVSTPENASFAFRAPLTVIAPDNLPMGVVGKRAKLAVLNYREGKFGGFFDVKLVELEGKPAK